MFHSAAHIVTRISAYITVCAWNIHIRAAARVLTDKYRCSYDRRNHASS